MQRLTKARFTPGMVVRMFADAAILQLALIAAMGLRLFWLVAFEIDQVEEGSGIEYVLTERFWDYLTFYTRSAWPLTAICLAFFYMFGFYTYGRYYQGRYKALVVFQAVTLSYMRFGFVTFFFRAITLSEIPRGALLLAYVFSVLSLVGARVWTRMWEQIVRPEHEAISRRSGRCVLVIGGAGYIGSALVRKLLERGYHVRLLDALLFGKEPIAHFSDHPNVEIIEGDFRHVENVVEAMQNVDSVVHLGAIVGDPACNLDESLTIDVNLSATRMIAELAKSAGVQRIVFASTCSVYGACDEVLDEHSIVKPVSLYGNTKLASERVLFSMANDHFRPTVVRFATIYGFSGRTRFDLVVNLLTAKAKIDGEITVFGGDQWRPFVHGDDAAVAVDVILDAPIELVGREIFNVGSHEQNHTISEIGEMIQQHVVDAKLTLSGNDGDIRNYRVDFSKIHNWLNYKPNWSVDQGIQQVLGAIASGEVTNYQDTRYSNVAFLRQEGTDTLRRDEWARKLLRDLANE